MFLVVGKGAFTKEMLMNKLIEWGIDPQKAISKAEKDKRFEQGNIRIMLVM
ncbi:hypothetical protein [Paenibacillus cremeus]|uniref:hypothetical protein n=1 Tax=Paenibacillus cremeus TaxID=2163881 RepID=UPI001645719E|nr:hypothetical protein [Paenibacillus cremeus]